MKKHVIALCIGFIFGLCGCSKLQSEKIENKDFLGNWTALSKNHMSISGDMVITPDSIEFTRKGRVEFEVIKNDGKGYILKINREVDSGYFMRLGPIMPSKYSDDEFEMEVAYYETKAKALEKRIDRTDNANSWGIYIRKENNIEQKNAPDKK